MWSRRSAFAHQEKIFYKFQTINYLLISEMGIILPVVETLNF